MFISLDSDIHRAIFRPVPIDEWCSSAKVYLIFESFKFQVSSGIHVKYVEGTFNQCWVVLNHTLVNNACTRGSYNAL